MKARVLLLLSLASLLAHSSAEQCGVQAGGALCPNGLCCSQWGWCGTTSEYCCDGCQSQCSCPVPHPLLAHSDAEQCGQQAGDALCPNGLCCSKWGFCGTTSAYCCDGCQSQCSCPVPRPHLPTNGVTQVINSSIFDKFLPMRNDPRCFAVDFFTFKAFVDAADTFPDFATTGDMETRKREIAAFFGQTSQKTTDGWPDAPGGQFAWGYCHNVEENPPNDYCVPSTKWPCVPGKTYYGRGPMMLSHNYNYGLAGEALGLDLLSNPDLVAQDAVVAFRTALWFWMTPQPPKPSCHDVIVGQWKPTEDDIAAGRLPGYGVITNIIDASECDHGTDPIGDGPIGFYKKYCDIYEISYGDNLDCYNQQPFGWGLKAKRGPNEWKASF